MKKTFLFVVGITLLAFSITSWAKDYTHFMVRNYTEHPKTLCVAKFTINEERNYVCSLGAGTYCSTEQFINLETPSNKKFKFTLTEYSCPETSEHFTNIDNSCQNRLIEVQPHLTTINIEGQPSNILTQTTRIICKVKDYYDN
jgi:hypothetical protein